MARDFVDTEGLNSADVQSLADKKPPADLPFDIKKIGHIVLRVTDVARTVDFYTRVLGFRISDVYPESMMPGKMVFMRCNEDHHGIAVVGNADGPTQRRELHHIAFEVATLDEVLRARDYLKRSGVEIVFEGRRRAGVQVAVEFLDPDGHILEIYWGLDQIKGDDKARPPHEWVATASLEDAIDHAPPGQDTTLADPSLRRS